MDFSFRSSTYGASYDAVIEEGEMLLRERIATGAAAVRTVLDCAAVLRIDPDSLSHIHAAALHATITELFGNCLVLAADQDHAIGIPILLRSMLEALVDLDNLLHDAEYVGNIEAANIKQLLKLLDSARTNPQLDGLLEGHPNDAQELRQRLRELEAAGRRSLSFERRFEMAGMQDQYNGVYALLCLDGHSNSAALADRHFDEGPDGRPQVSFFRQPDPTTIARRLTIGLRILARSGEMIHAAFQVPRRGITDLAASVQA